MACRLSANKTLRIRFSLVAFDDPSTTLFGVIGSLPALGNWDPQRTVPLQFCNSESGLGTSEAVQLVCTQPFFWSGIVDVGPESELVPFSYKFIRWKGSASSAGKASVNCSESSWTNEEILNFLKATPSRVGKDHSAGVNVSSLTWEGRNGSQSNRVFLIAANRSRSQNASTASRGLPEPIPCDTAPHGFTHVYNPVLNLTADGVYSLPVQEFQDPNADTSEYTHTTRFFHDVKRLGMIHYNKIMDRVYVGSCPRSLLHVDKLRDQHLISDIINFQTAEDISEHYPDSGGTPMKSNRTAENAAVLYASRGIRYTWIPTTDMSSVARARVTAQAAFLMAGLLFSKNCTGVYVHCNAGVGRSVGCVAAFLACYLQIPPRITNLIITSRRPVAFFDEPALLFAMQDYSSKFAEAGSALRAMLPLPQVREDEDSNAN